MTHCSDEDFYALFLACSFCQIPFVAMSTDLPDKAGVSWGKKEGASVPFPYEQNMLQYKLGQSIYLEDGARNHDIFIVLYVVFCANR